MPSLTCKNTISTNMCSLEEFKVHWAGTRKLVVFTTTAMVCKQGVTSKQEWGGLIGVCVGVLITFLQLIPAGQHIQMQNREHFQLMSICCPGSCWTHERGCFHLHIFWTKQIRQLFRVMIYGMRIDILAHGPPIYPVLKFLQSETIGTIRLVQSNSSNVR